jgi:DNA-binding beta-propeller fold protein YncE
VIVRHPVLVAALALLFGGVATAGLTACAKATDDRFDPSAPGDPDSGGFAQEASSKPDPSGAGEVFGHSENTLFRVDTVTRSVTEIGTFQGCTYVADIALDQASNIYASTGSELFLVETNTAHCTRIAGGTFPNSLSFVPAGTVEADREALVGFQGGDYVKIDPTTGVVTKVGEIGNGLQSSGDVVSAKGGKTYVTVKGKDCADCLVEIDPATGKSTHNWGPIGKPDVFGLAFWAGDLYAFTNAGELLLITLDTGKLVSTPITITNAPAKFWGAGSTTSAPTGPVR